MSHPSVAEAAVVGISHEIKGQAIAAFEGFFSRGFWFGSFLPVAMFAALNALNLLRVSKAGEIEGLDLDQHGITAYPEYVMSPISE